ncbi:hypothetical protein POM88_051216 [Heracleum sosnowskyi]|uniref:Uncharacterized protein n=1 Tax=Heracleum sosnowskyi TaxID=360622 RepID=A0AAD8M129_9APIA|nr:hypothetical protein POM88_051216 [Heracleum sosnowskyi]
MLWGGSSSFFIVQLGLKDLEKRKDEIVGLVDGKKKAEELATYWEDKYKQVEAKVMKLENDMVMIFASYPVLEKSVEKIVSRVDPFTHNLVQKYGKISMFWLGKTPRLNIMDPELVKEVLSNKLGHFQKPSLNPLILILTNGLTTLEGETWATHRRIISPAFHLEKLKVKPAVKKPVKKVDTSGSDDSSSDEETVVPAKIAKPAPKAKAASSSSEESDSEDDQIQKLEMSKLEKFVVVHDRMNQTLQQMYYSNQELQN